MDSPRFERHRAALEIIDGCADIGRICHDLHRASEEIAGQPVHRQREDCALRLMALQLAHLCGVGGETRQLDFDRTVERCQLRADHHASAGTPAGRAPVANASPSAPAGSEHS